MKYVLVIFGVIIFTACSQGTKNKNAESMNPSIVGEFLQNSDVLENVEVKNPIASFSELADDQAMDKMDLDKKNIEDLLEKAKEYSHTVIIVEDHTIVKITDLSDCTKSSSWGACMPVSEGFIKKGDLLKKVDYLNNIIGLPDDQKRTAYFFE